jgi:hypothetical protein
MTTKTRIALTPNPSNQAEIEWLREVAAEVPADSYLAAFLRPDAVEWFAAQVNDNVSCDLYGALVYEQKEHAKTGANMRVEYEAHKAGWQKKLEAVEKDAMQAKAERVALEDRLEVVKAERDTNAQAYKGVSEALDDASDNAVCLGEALEDAEIQVRNLKAKIFDLLVQAGRVTL